MTLRHAVDQEARLVTVSGAGDDALAEATGVTQRILADSTIRKGFRILILADDAFPSPSPDEIAGLAGLARQLRSRTVGRIAIVTSAVEHTTPAELVSLLGSTATLGVTEEIRAFVNEAEARAWLDRAVR